MTGKVDLVGTDDIRVVAIGGYKGKAESHTQKLGHFFNYGCSSKDNPIDDMDKVKAKDGDVEFDRTAGNWSYRFCCCRHTELFNDRKITNYCSISFISFI